MRQGISPEAHVGCDNGCVSTPTLTQLLAETADANGGMHPALVVVGAVIVAALFGAMVWRTVKRNRLK